MTCLQAFLATFAVALFAGCMTSSSSGVCTSTSDTGPCTGTFSCGNSGIHGFCDRSTQVCVVMPGSVTCETIAGASASSCPTEEQAGNLVGCQTPFVASCSGSPADGITVTCAPN